MKSQNSLWDLGLGWKAPLSYESFLAAYITVWLQFKILQGAAGKYQIAQEKTQMELDKSHQEIDILREKMERNQGESRRVSKKLCIIRSQTLSSISSDV